MRSPPFRPQFHPPFTLHLPPRAEEEEGFRKSANCEHVSGQRLKTAIAPAVMTPVKLTSANCLGRREECPLWGVSSREIPERYLPAHLQPSRASPSHVSQNANQE